MGQAYLGCRKDQATKAMAMLLSSSGQYPPSDCVPGPSGSGPALQGWVPHMLCSGRATWARSHRGAAPAPQVLQIVPTHRSGLNTTRHLGKQVPSHTAP